MPHTAPRAATVPVLLILALAAAVRGADDLIVEEEPPPLAPPLVVPPRPPIQMRQMPRGRPGGPADVRREPYLGVVTEPLADQLRAHLDLPEGVGLVVEAVAADGPAGRAGVLRFDVLRRFDDQIICSADQLAVLVRAAGKGSRVKLTLIRRGKEQVVDVVVDDREVAGGEPAPGPFAGLPGLPLNLDGLFDAPLPGGAPGFGEDIRLQVQRQVQEAIERAQAGGFGADAAARVPWIQSGVSQKVAVVADGRGTVEIRETDGRRTVTVKDRDGRPLHAGPLDTDGDRERVPEAFRDMVREVEGRLGGGPPPAAPRAPAAEAEEEDI